MTSVSDRGIAEAVGSGAGAGGHQERASAVARGSNVRSLDSAREAIEKGSSSFAAAARLFDPVTREGAVLLYAWCRHCDDVIDGQQLGHGQRHGDRSDGLARLAGLQHATALACAGRPDGSPIFEGLARIVVRHQLPERLLFEHLQGFRMDVVNHRFETIDDTLLYSYRVAGVVGLLMARVMGTQDPAALDRACDLGIAFQFTNIARDIVEDAQVGRVYVPAEWLADAGVPPGELLDPAHRPAIARVAARLVAAAEPYYRSARAGLPALNWRSAWSVATARDVYRAIGHEVVRRGEQAWDQRVSTSTAAKLRLAARGAGVALFSRGQSVAPRDPGLWRRPADTDERPEPAEGRCA